MTAELTSAPPDGAARRLGPRRRHRGAPGLRGAVGDARGGGHRGHAAARRRPGRRGPRAGAHRARRRPAGARGRRRRPARAGSAPRSTASPRCSSDTPGPRAPEGLVGDAFGRVTRSASGLQMGTLLAFLGSRVLGPVRPVRRPREGRAPAARRAQRRRRPRAPSTSTPRTSPCGSACTRPPTGCSSPPSTGCATTSAPRSRRSRAGSTAPPSGAVDRLPEIVKAVRRDPPTRRARAGRDVPGPRAARRARPAARPDHPARGPRRARHGRRRPRGRRLGVARSGRASPPGAGAAASSTALLRTLLGVDAKIKQYEQGRVFVDHVVDVVGLDGLNAVWTSPETLPLRAEITDPAPGSPASTADRPARCASRSRSPTVRRAVREAFLAAANGRFAASRRTNSPFAVVVACSGGADSLALAAAAVHVAPGRGARGRRRPRPAGRLGRARAGGPPGSSATWGSARADVVAVEVGTAGRARRRRPRARPGTRRCARRRRRHGGRAGPARSHARRPGRDRAPRARARVGGALARRAWRAWDPPWCRPLLGVRRATTRAACAAAGLAAWDDPHNDDPRYTRVRLRHEVLPLLEDVLAGGVAPALARTAAQLADDDAALAALADGRRRELRRRRRHPRRGRASRPTRPRSGAGCCGRGCPPPGSRSSATRTCAPSTPSSPRGADRGAPPLPGGLEVVRAHGRLRVARGAGAATAPHGPTTDAVRSSTTVYDGDIASVLITEEQIQDKIADLADRDRRRRTASTSRTSSSSACSRAP